MLLFPVSFRKLLVESRADNLKVYKNGQLHSRYHHSGESHSHYHDKKGFSIEIDKESIPIKVNPFGKKSFCGFTKLFKPIEKNLLQNL